MPVATYCEQDCNCCGQKYYARHMRRDPSLRSGESPSGMSGIFKPDRLSFENNQSRFDSRCVRQWWRIHFALYGEVIRRPSDTSDQRNHLESGRDRQCGEPRLSPLLICASWRQDRSVDLPPFDGLKHSRLLSGFVYRPRLLLSLIWSRRY
jgi:hypothetical protein